MEEKMDSKFIQQFYQDKRGETWWQDIDPLCRFIMCLSLSVATFTIGSWQMGLCAVIFGFIIAGCTKKVKFYMGMLLLVFISAGILGAIVRIPPHLNDGGAIAFTIFGVSVPMSALMNYLDYLLMMEGFAGLLIVYFLTTEMRDICYCLERKGMSPKGTFLVLVAFSMITSIQQKLSNVRESQSARGIEMEGNFGVKVKTIIPILFPVIISSVTSVEERTLAMNARAFGASRHNSHLRNLKKAGALDIGLMWICVAVSVLLIVLF